MPALNDPTAGLAMIGAYAHAVMWAAAALYLLWALYLAAQALNRARVEGTWRLPARVLGWPLVIAAAALDVAVNLVLGTLLLADRPREWTLSQRLARLEKGRGWRAVAARWICQELLDAFDPGGRHCT